jgi:hypothetical protein
MSNKNATESESESCQADCNQHSLPDPSLWNSALGRRSFMKKTGMATAATTLALHGFKLEVLANASATPTCGTKSVQTYFSWVQTSTQSGSGSGATPAEAIAKAVALAKLGGDGGSTTNDIAPGPGDFSSVSKCAIGKTSSSGSVTNGSGQAPSVGSTGDSGVVDSPQRYTATVTVYSGTTMWYRKTYTNAPGHPNSSECTP